jgi:hypothetical protein
MKKLLLALALLLLPALSSAQSPSTTAVLLYRTVDPVGICSPRQFVWQLTSNHLWVCETGLWYDVTAGAGTSFPLLAPVSCAAPSYSFITNTTSGLCKDTTGFNEYIDTVFDGPGTTFGRLRLFDNGDSYIQASDVIGRTAQLIIAPIATGLDFNTGTTSGQMLLAPGSSPYWSVSLNTGGPSSSISFQSAPAFQFRIPNGTVTNPGLVFNGDLDTGIFLTGTFSSAFAVASAGNEMFRSDANDNGTKFKWPVAVQTLLSPASGVYAQIGGVVTVGFTTTGNVGVGEDNLTSYAMPANTLASFSHSLLWRTAGTFAATANNKQVRVYFGATAIFDTGVLVTAVATDWEVQCEVFHMAGIGGIGQKAICSWISDDTVLDRDVDYSEPNETVSGAITFRITGEATANNDIQARFTKVEWRPAP